MSSELLMSLKHERRILMTFSNSRKSINYKKKNSKTKKHNYNNTNEKLSKSKEVSDNKKIKEKITEALELPKEILLNISKMTIIGNQELVIENYKGVVEYSSTLIRINTGNSLLKITGRNLNIKEISSEDIKITGRFGSLEFQN